MRPSAAGFALSCLLVAPGALAQGVFEHRPTAGNLQALFEKLHAAISAGQTTTALELTRPLLPDEARLRKALTEDVSSETVRAMAGWFDSALPRDDAGLARVFRADPENTEVHVYAATTGEIAACAEGEAPCQHFPGGARTLAQSVLRPGVTFYEVQLVKPGERLGMTFHLFYWDGQRWTMLGPQWRALR